jgi:hypothetical protein
MLSRRSDENYHEKMKIDNTSESHMLKPAGLEGKQQH